MSDEGVRDIERLLRNELVAPVPAARPDLVARTIRRVQSWILVGDLLRLTTFEGFWMSRDRADADAERLRERQDS